MNESDFLILMALLVVVSIVGIFLFRAAIIKFIKHIINEMSNKTEGGG